MARTQNVMDPGFGGFDALGRLPYYAGLLTPFQRSVEALGANAPEAALHYFENVPTAGVTTRASILARWLAKRVLRGEFGPGDRVVLIGHSTGGLDIRALIRGLARHAEGGQTHLVFDVPGEARATDRHRQQLAADVLELVRRAVFISAPHRGTLIAEWIAVNALLTKPARNTLVQATDRIGRWGPVARFLSDPARRYIPMPGLVEAILAAVDDSHVGLRADPLARVDAISTRMALEGWARQMDGDLGAIHDLERGSDQTRDDKLDHEAAYWANRPSVGIATYSPRPVQPLDDLGDWSFSLADARRLAPKLFHALSAPTAADWLYALAWKACAEPIPLVRPILADGPALPPGTPCIGRAPAEVGPDSWAANDGIVNTASMLTPWNTHTLGVCADHGDIIGHYTRRPETPQYDLLQSGAHMTTDTFEAVWGAVFRFSLTGDWESPA